MSEQLAFQELPPWSHPLWTFPSMCLSYTLGLAGWVIHCSRSLSQCADFQALFIPPKIQPTDCLKIQITHLIRWALGIGHPIALRWNYKFSSCFIFPKKIFFAPHFCVMWDLSSRTGLNQRPLQWKRSLNHWASREVPPYENLIPLGIKIAFSSSLHTGNCTDSCL